MKDRTKYFLASLGWAVAGCALILRSRAAKWRRETEAMAAELKQAAAANSETVSFQDFDQLPAPVAAYFRFALQDGQKRIRTATIQHEGEFCLNDKWIPFVSTQVFSSHPAGFVWDAKMKMNRLLNVRVRDSYLHGRGAMTVNCCRSFRLWTRTTMPQLDAGSLMRYLAEAAWLPTALLPSKT